MQISLICGPWCVSVEALEVLTAVGPSDGAAWHTCAHFTMHVDSHGAVSTARLPEPFSLRTGSSSLSAEQRVGGAVLQRERGRGGPNPYGRRSQRGLR